MSMFMVFRKSNTQTRRTVFYHYDYEARFMYSRFDSNESSFSETYFKMTKAGASRVLVFRPKCRHPQRPKQRITIGQRDTCIFIVIIVTIIYNKNGVLAPQYNIRVEC